MPAASRRTRTSPSTKPAFKLKYRNQAPEVIRKTRPVQKDCYACREYNYDWFANDLDEPYTTPPGKPFSWQGRLRVTGGRTNVWGRQSYRLSDLDFKAASHDGYGVDWPLSYKDLAPYYDIVEELRRHHRHARRRARAARRAVSAAHGLDLRRDAVCATRVKEKLGRTVTLGRSRQHHQAASTAAAPATIAAPASTAASPIPTSTPISPPSPTPSTRAALHPHSQRHGLQGADGSGHQQGQRAFSTSIATRVSRKEVHAPRGDPVRPGAGVGAHPVQLAPTSSTPTVWPTPAACWAIT